MSVDRRQFLRMVGALAYGAAWLPPPAIRGRSASGSVASIALMGAGVETAYGRGVTLGMEEGERSAELLRRPSPFVRVDAPTRGGVDALLSDLRERGVQAVVAALPEEAQSVLEAAAVAKGLVVMDARARRPDPSGPPGSPLLGTPSETPSETPSGTQLVFRTGLPAGDYDRALRQALPPASAPPPAPASGAAARAVLWHEDLFRYGAQQLNDRYRLRFGAGMTGEAWAGWMAVKALTEAVLRSRGGGAAELVERLGGSRAAFDGHKGVPLRFSGPGRTLAQPLYAITEEPRDRG